MHGNHRTERYASGSVREVAHVAWPIVVSMLSYTAMGVVDTLFVGRLGKTELAAVGIATTAFFLVNALFLGTLRSVKVVSAQSTGADRDDRAVRAGWIGAVLAVPFGLAVLGLGFLGGPIFAALGGSPAVQVLAGEYFAIRAAGAGLWYGNMALCNYFQGTGDTRTPMAVNLVANGVNVAVDPLLIFGLGPVPALGVEGAALATIVAQCSGLVVVASLFVRSVGAEPEWSSDVAGEVLRLGAPMGVQGALGVGGFTAFTAMLARMGEAPLAAHQVAIKIVSVSFLPGNGLSQAASILVGQYVGAGEPSSARRSFRSAVGLGVAVMGACGVLFFAFPETLIRAFNDHPDVVEIGANLLWVGAVFQVFDAVAMITTGALNGAGDTRYTMWVNVSCTWLVLVPGAYLFGYVLSYGAVGAWMGLTAEILAIAILVLARFVGNGWADET